MLIFKGTFSGEKFVKGWDALGLKYEPLTYSFSLCCMNKNFGHFPLCLLFRTNKREKKDKNETKEVSTEKD
jgi:hypothetical protein